MDETLLELAQRIWRHAYMADVSYGTLEVRGPDGVLLTMECKSEQAARNVLIALAKEDA